eukprot:2731956-Amphidinium_carterae.1
MSGRAGYVRAIGLLRPYFSQNHGPAGRGANRCAFSRRHDSRPGVAVTGVLARIAAGMNDGRLFPAPRATDN